MRKLKAPHAYAQAVREGASNGKRAAWLPAVDYPALVAENLDSARQRLGIERPVVYESIPEDARNPVGA